MVVLHGNGFSQARQVVRRRIVLAGTIVAVVGLALQVIPIPTSVPSHVFYSNVRSFYGENVTAPYRPLWPELAIIFTASWSSTPNQQGHGATGNSVKVFSCGTDATCRSLNASDPVALGAGATGSVTWTGTFGEYFQVVAGGLESGSNLTVQVTEYEPLFGGFPGFAMVIAGLGVGVVGSRMKRVAGSPPPPAS